MKRILVILALSLFLFGFKSCQKIPQSGEIRISTKTVQSTPNGATVFSEKGIAQSRLEAIDFELAKVFQDAKNSGYTERIDEYGFLQFYVPADGCTPSPEQGIPSFKIRADNYDGSSFDQYNPKGVGVKDGIGVIYAAEMIMDVGTPQSSPPIGQAVVCDSPIIGTAARNGAEHILIGNNDVDYWAETATHSNGQGHPLLPHVKTSSLAAAKPPQPFIAPVR